MTGVIRAGMIEMGVGYNTQDVQRMMRDLQRQIQQTPLLPVADLGNMHEFNRVMDSKGKDWRKLHREIDSAPLVPKVDFSQVTASRNELKRLKSDLAGIASSPEIKSTVAITVAHTVDGTQAARSIKGAFEDSRDIVKEAIRDGLSSARLGGGFGGNALLQGAGIGLGQRATDSVLTGLRTAAIARGGNLGSVELLFERGFSRLFDQLDRRLVQAQRNQPELRELIQDAQSRYVDFIGDRRLRQVSASQRFEQSQRNQRIQDQAVEQSTVERRQILRDLPSLRQNQQDLKSRRRQIQVELDLQTLDYQGLTQSAITAEEAISLLEAQYKKLDTLRNQRKTLQSLKAQYFDEDRSPQEQATARQAFLIGRQKYGDVNEQIAAFAGLPSRSVTAESISPEQILAVQERAFAPMVEEAKAKIEAFRKQIEEIDYQQEQINRQIRQARAGLSTIKEVAGDRRFNSTYGQLAFDVARQSGLKITSDQIPALEVSKDLPKGAEASFRKESNVITISVDLAKQLKEGNLSPQAQTTLVHELRHAAQAGFGDAQTLIDARRGIAPQNFGLRTPNSEQISRFGDRIDFSVQGGENTQLNRLLEQDAYTFADTFEAQARIIKKESEKMLTPLEMGVKKVKEILKVETTVTPFTGGNPGMFTVAGNVARTGYSGLKRVEENFFDLDPLGIPYAAKPLIQGAAMFGAGSMVVPGVGGAILHGGAAVGGGLTAGGINAIAGQVAANSPAIAAPIIQAIGQGIAATFGVGGSAVGAGVAALGAGGIAGNVAKAGINAVVPGRSVPQGAESFARLVGDNVELREGLRQRYQALRAGISKKDKALIAQEIKQLEGDIASAQSKLLGSAEMLADQGASLGQDEKLGRIIDGLKQSYTKMLKGLGREASKLGDDFDEATIDIEAESEQFAFSAEQLVDEVNLLFLKLKQELGLAAKLTYDEQIRLNNLDKQTTGSQSSYFGTGLSGNQASGAEFRASVAEAQSAQARFDQSFNQFEQVAASVDDVRQPGATGRVREFFADIKQGLDDIRQRYPIIDQLKGKIIELGFALGGLIGAYSLADFALNFSRDSLAIAASVDAMEDRLSTFGTGQGYQGFERLMAIAQDLGLEYRTLEQDYLRMSAVLSRTEFAENAEEVFNSLARATQGFQPGETTRFFTAVQQVIDKGALEREEFRTQFGDLPGVSQIIREAIGGSNQLFQERLSNRDISSGEFIRSLTEYLDTYGARLDNAVTKQNRFNNAVTDLQVITGEAVQPAYLTALDAAGGLLQLVANNTEALTFAAQTYGAYLAGVLFGRLQEFIAYNGLMSASNLTLAGTFGKVQAAAILAGKGLLAVSKAIALPAATVATFSIIKDTLDSATQSSDALEDGIKRIDAAMFSLSQNAEKVKEATQDGLISDSFFGGLGDQAIARINQAQRTVNRFFGVDENQFRLTTRGDLEQNKIIEDLQGSAAKVSELFSQIDKNNPQSIRAANESVKALLDMTANLEQLEKTNPELFQGIKETLENTDSTAESLSEYLDKIRESGEGVASVFKSFKENLEDITREFQLQNSLLERQSTYQLTGIAQQRLLGTLTPQQASLLSQEVELETLRLQAQQQRQRLAGLQGLTVETEGLTPAEIEAQQQELQDSIEQASNQLASTNLAIINAQQAIKDEVEQQEATYLQTYRELKQSVEGYYQQLRDAQRSIDRSIKDYVESIGEQILQARRDIEQLQLENELSNQIIPLRQALVNTGSDMVSGIVNGIIGILESINDKAQRQIQAQARIAQIESQIRQITAGSARLREQSGQTQSQLAQQRNALGLQAIQGQASVYGLSPLQTQQALGQVTNSGLINPVEGIWNAEGGYDADSGLDLIVPEGTRAIAAASGNLVYAEQGHNAWMHEDSSASLPGFQPQHSILVELDQPFEYSGKLIRYMWYTHLQAIEESIKNKGSDLGLPTRIEAGQVLGEIGKANNVPHLHFGLLSNRRQRHEGDWLDHRQVREILYGSGGGLNLHQRVSAPPAVSTSTGAIPVEVISPMGADHLNPQSSRSSLNLSEKDLANLALTSVLEATGPQNQMDVAMAIMARTLQRGKSATQVAFEPGQFEVNHGHSPVSTIDEAIRQSGGRGQAIRTLLNNLQSPSFVENSIAFLNGATDFRGQSLLGNRRSGDPYRGDSGANWFLQESQSAERANQLRALFGSSATAGLPQSGGTTQIQSLNLPGLVEPNFGPADQVTQALLLERSREIEQIQQQAEQEQKLAEINIQLQQKTLKDSIESTILENDLLNETQRQRATLADLYQGLPSELIPSELRDTEDLAFLDQVARIKDEVRLAQRSAEDLVDTVALLNQIPGFRLEQAGIDQEMLDRLRESVVLRKQNLDAQLEEIERAQTLRETFEQIEAERERARRDTEASQEVFDLQLKIQGQIADELAREGAIWQANAVNRRAATQEIQNQLDLELRRIDLLRDDLALGRDIGFTAEQLDELESLTIDSAQRSQEAVSSQYQSIAGSILETTRQATRGTIANFRQLVQESENFGDFFDNLLTRIIDTASDALFQIIADLATNALFDGLGSLFGGSSPSGGGFLDTLFGVGSSVAGAVGGSGISALNFGGLPSLASDGAILPGYGGGDRRPFLLEDGEAVLRKEVVRVLSPELIESWNNKGITKAMRGFAPAPVISRGAAPIERTEPETPSYSEPIQVKTQVINNVEYATKEELLRATKQASERGAQQALSKMRNSVGTRRSIGI